MTHESLDEKRNKIYMNGQRGLSDRRAKLTIALQAAIRHSGLMLEQVDWVVPHQGNLKRLIKWQRILGIPYDRFV